MIVGMRSHANLLRDLGDELRRQAVAARATARERPDDAFVQGEAHAYYSVLSLIQQQAAVLEVPPEDVALDGFDAERDLL
jgi:hypothetical protein